MAVPLLTKKIVKKRVKHFKRPQSDRKICVKVNLCYDCCNQPLVRLLVVLGGF